MNKSTGLHVHFDASKLSDKHFCRIFNNYAKIEAVIDSFMPQSRRKNNNVYCHSLLEQSPLLSIADSKQRVLSILRSRYFKVNAQSYLRYKTIEFRQHAGTTDFEKINNWITFLRKLIQFSFEKDIQECSSIEEIPFLSYAEKQYFINRKNLLN